MSFRVGDQAMVRSLHLYGRLLLGFMLLSALFNE
jgi:hypothetical protein